MSTIDQQQIKITKDRITGAVYRVVNVLGSRFPSEVYRNALAHELTKMNSDVKVDHALNIYYDGEVVGKQPIDILVDRTVLVIIQGNDKHDLKKSTLRHILMATGQRLGLIISFDGNKPKIEQVSYKL